MGLRNRVSSKEALKVLRHLIFVSCGQYTSEEIALGKMVVGLINDTPHLQAYFAELQSTPEGLATNIFDNLYMAVGVILIMHPRGEIQTPKENKITRASVWIEQEIAIVAFMTQLMHKTLKVRTFLHKGISREGVRQVLMLNPFEFSDDSEVLREVEKFLPVWSKEAKPEISIRCEVETVSQESKKQHRLRLSIVNESRSDLTTYRVDLRFPKILVPSGASHWLHHPAGDSDSFICLRVTDQQYGKHPIAPGESKEVCNCVFDDPSFPELLLDFRVDLTVDGHLVERRTTMLKSLWQK
jgi:hypothetical protein